MRHTKENVMRTSLFAKTTFISLAVITMVTVGFRLYKFDTPIIEYHSWRQVDTLAVARNFVRDGFDLLHPRYDDISSLQSGLENPSGYRMVEFPIYNSIIAIFQIAMPIMPIEQSGRLVSIVLSCISTMLIFCITKNDKNILAAWLSALIFATFPFFVFYTRAVLPEVLAMTLVLISISIAQFNSRRFWVKSTISFLFFALAILTKPTAIFYGLVPFVLLTFEKPINRNRLISTFVVSLISIFPLFIWREYIKSFPEGIPSSEWLITHTNTSFGLENIFFKPAFFRWIFFERINVLILGSFISSLALFGFLGQSRKFVHVLMGISSFAYLFTFQGGNIQHEYYQILILPTLAILTGVGIDYIIKLQKNIIYTLLSYLAIFSLLTSSWFVSYDKVRHYYYSLSDIPQFAKIVQSLTDKNDKIVVDTGGDTTALFVFDRKGSPAITSTPDNLKKQGYSYLFTYNQETANNYIRDFDVEVIFKNNRFVLLKL